MTFTVTPQPSNFPPRVRIDIDTDSSTSTFTSLTIYRDGKKIREQPYVGSRAALAFDYEAPFGKPASYTVVGSVSASSAVYSTAWPNLTGWSTVSGTPAVSSGRLTSGRVQRSVSLPTQGRLVLNGAILSPFSGGADVYLGPQLRVTAASTGSPGGESRQVIFNGSARAISHASGDLILQWDSLGLTITSPTGSWYIPGVFDPSGGYIQAGGTGSSVPGFTLTSLGSSTPFSGSASTTLSINDAWLIHPSQPTLSIPIQKGPGGDFSLRSLEASSGESKTSKAASTIHEPVGRRRPVVITHGPRQADDWTMVIYAKTIGAKDAVRAIVDDQTPLLLRAPSTIAWDLPDDWYSIGDVEVQRLTSPIINEMTLVTLPLTPVDEPIVRQGALWTYGSDLAANPTYADSKARFPTYLDRLAGAS